MIIADYFLPLLLVVFVIIIIGNKVLSAFKTTVFSVSTNCLNREGDTPFLKQELKPLLFSTVLSRKWTIFVTDFVAEDATSTKYMGVCLMRSMTCQSSTVLSQLSFNYRLG